MHEFELISNILCPYTQRVAIQLGEKGLSFKRTYVDLASKPDWFVRISPLGKVPVLRTGDSVLFETAVICEYIEEMTDGDVPMWPHARLDRARHRAWAEYASAVIADVFGFYMAPDEAIFDRKRSELAGRFSRLEQHLSNGGPYFDGQQFGLVDAAFAPVFRLLNTFDEVGDFRLLDGLSKTVTYRRNLAERSSVRAAVTPDYDRIFLRYLSERGSHMARLTAAMPASLSIEA
jgi:glutathione S-transferase